MEQAPGGTPILSNSAEITLFVCNAEELRAAMMALESSLGDTFVLANVIGKKPYKEGIIAKQGEDVIGVAVIEVVGREESVAMISRFVRPGAQFRRQGVGISLLDEALKLCRKKGYREAQVHSVTTQGAASVEKFLAMHPEWKTYLQWTIDPPDSERLENLSARVDEENSPT